MDKSFRIKEIIFTLIIISKVCFLEKAFLPGSFINSKKMLLTTTLVGNAMSVKYQIVIEPSVLC